MSTRETSTAGHPEESEEDAAWRERDRALQEAFARARSAQAHGEESLSSLKHFGPTKEGHLPLDQTEKSDLLDFDLDDDDDNDEDQRQRYGASGSRLQQQQSPRTPPSASKRFSSQNDVGLSVPPFSSSTLPRQPLNRRISSSQNDVSGISGNKSGSVKVAAVAASTGMSRSAMRRQETLAAAAAAREARTKEAAMKRALERQNPKATATSPLAKKEEAPPPRPSWSTRARDGGEQNTSTSTAAPPLLQLSEEKQAADNYAIPRNIHWQVQAQDLEGFGALPDEFNADDYIGNNSSSSSARNLPRDLPPEVAAAAAAVEAWAKEEEEIAAKAAAKAATAGGGTGSDAEPSFAASSAASNSVNGGTDLDPSFPPSSINSSSSNGAFASFQGLSSGGKLRCDLVDLRARADACRHLVERAVPHFGESNHNGGGGHSGYLSPGKKLQNRSGMPTGASSSSSANTNGRSLLSPSKRLAQAQQQQQQPSLPLEPPSSRGRERGLYGGSSSSGGGGVASSNEEDAFSTTLAMGMRVYQEAASNVFRDLGVVQEAAASLSDHSKGGAQVRKMRKAPYGIWIWIWIWILLSPLSIPFFFFFFQSKEDSLACQATAFCFTLRISSVVWSL